LAWLARHFRREKEQVDLVAELNQAEIYAWQYEPNSAEWALQALPLSAQEWLVPRYFRWKFIYSPSRISVLFIRDDAVSYLIDKLRRLPYLTSVSFRHGQISPESEEKIRKALPSVEIDIDPRIGLFPCKSPSCQRCSALSNRRAKPGPIGNRRTDRSTSVVRKAGREIRNGAPPVDANAQAGQPGENGGYR
jgi:hypothetical protein